MVILCTASRAHLSWEQLQFVSELFLLFRNGAVGEGKKKSLIKFSTQTDREKSHSDLCICRCIFSQTSSAKESLEQQPNGAKAEILLTSVVGLYPIVAMREGQSSSVLLYGAG